MSDDINKPFTTKLLIDLRSALTDQLIHTITLVRDIYIYPFSMAN